MFLGMTVALAVTASDAVAGPSVRLDPDSALLERWPDPFELNCDFIVENKTPEGGRLAEIQLLIRDEGGRAMLRRFVNASGMNPGLNTIPKREVEPGETVRVFNPFYSLDKDRTSTTSWSRAPSSTWRAPSSFGGFSKVVGGRSIPAPRRPLDTGEILEVP